MPITYPISGFEDDISNKMWYIFYSYILDSTTDEARRHMELVNPKLDNLDPIDYGPIVVSRSELPYLLGIDSFLHEFVGKWIVELDSSMCAINSVIFAHYMRAKLFPFPDHQSNADGLAAVRRLKPIVRRVWKMETNANMLFEFLGAIEQLILRQKNNYIRN